MFIFPPRFLLIGSPLQLSLLWGVFISSSVPVVESLRSDHQRYYSKIYKYSFQILFPVWYDDLQDLPCLKIRCGYPLRLLIIIAMNIQTIGYCLLDITIVFVSGYWPNIWKLSNYTSHVSTGICLRSIGPSAFCVMTFLRNLWNPMKTTYHLIHSFLLTFIISLFCKFIVFYLLPFQAFIIIQAAIRRWVF